jgi:hypothetical protein
MTPPATQRSSTPRARTANKRQVPRTLLSRKEAAESMGMSLSTWERRVQPDVRVVVAGQLVLVAPRELDRWARDRERAPIPTAR